MTQRQPFPLEGYRLQAGTRRDRAKLIQFMALAYDEQEHHCSPPALAETVNAHYADDAPLWWVLPETESTAIACLWLGNAFDPHQGDRYGCILLLYVDPEHRRRGIATALLQQAQNWATDRGDQRLGLQVFADNKAAQALYQKLGYVTTALWMTQPLQ